MKALRFNPLDDSTEFSEIETEFKTVDGFYYAAKPHGPYLMGEVWKDTAGNRQLIQAIINLKKELKKYQNTNIEARYKLLNIKEK